MKVAETGLECHFADGGTCGFQMFGGTEKIWEITRIGTDYSPQKTPSGDQHGKQTKETETIFILSLNLHHVKVNFT